MIVVVAFEIAHEIVGSASNAIKDGYAVQIAVEGKPAGKVAFGRN
jgi:hypothetical protein